MELLQSLIPSDIKRKIFESSQENIVDSCSLLLEFLRPLPDFQKLIRELTEPELSLFRKSKEAALDSKQKGNECFAKGDYPAALNFYCQALRHAPTDVDDASGRNLVSTLYINRATAIHKMGLFEETLRDCNRAIMFTPTYAKAWYRRGKVNCSLKNYQTAACDLEVALSMEKSFSGKVQIQKELEALVTTDFKRIKVEDSYNTSSEKIYDASDELQHGVMECILTPFKGRGMASVVDTPPASLIHCEEPVAAIVSKSCRETHCHFCFRGIPADVIYCPSCTIPVYCSLYCQENALGVHLRANRSSYIPKENFTGKLEKHIAEALLSSCSEYGTEGRASHFSEHINECKGRNWPAILPSDVVLAGRVMVHFTACRTIPVEVSKPLECLDFAHNYLENPPNTKLELHIYAAVLSQCLECCSSYFPSVEFFASQLVLLIAQIKVNSMAIVCIKSSKGFCLSRSSSIGDDDGSSSTCNMEQVRVGQALYSIGSFFNHSCEPNAHSYFISRKLFIRTIKYIPASSPLELSYGPQLGEWGLLDRQKFLQEQYSFKCQCTGCSWLKFSDLVINSLSCPKSNCRGVIVEETCNFKLLKDGHLLASNASVSCKLTLPASEEVISSVAYILHNPGATCRSRSGYCSTCGSLVNVVSSRKYSDKGMRSILRLRDCASSAEDKRILVLDCLEAIRCIRSVNHQYSKVVAQAEDCISKVLVQSGELKSAMQHCQASIKILEKLYGCKHIVIGNELAKLASIELSVGDHASALRNIDRMEEIFQLHYGCHASKLFPYLESLGGRKKF